MDPFDYREENSHCVRSSSTTKLCSSLGNNLPENNLTSQTESQNNSAWLSGDLDEGADSMNQPEDDSPPIDISSALRSVVLKHTWDLKKMPKLFSVPGLQEDNSTVPPVDEQDDCSEGDADPAQEEIKIASFQSKYIHIFPLYQDYCEEVKDDLHRLKDSLVSELITPQYLQSLQSRLSPCSNSEATSSPPPQPIKVTPCTLWQDLDEVKASALLSRLTPRQIRLQESMFELIGSEASYLRSLGVAVNHFYMSGALKQTLSQMEHRILFSNIQQLMAASEKFLMDLEMRLGESVLVSQVGDVVLRHCREFHRLYVPYVMNMMHQEALVNQQLQENRDFLDSVRKLERDPVCQRQTLKSFLVLPFQRITRIKLLLESILKLTEPDSDAVSNLEKAIDAIHEIVTECDKGIKKIKQIEELVCLEMLLDFGKFKAVPVVVSQRFLVHQGPVKQLTVESTYTSRKSFISIYLHLFNDLLIISSKKDQRFTVVDHAEFPAHVTTERLKTEVLGLPSDSFLLHLSQSHTGHPTAMILVAHTRSDKEAWMKALSSKP